MPDKGSAQTLEELLGGGSAAIDWQEYLHAIRERLWIVLLCLALGGIGAAIFISRQVETFQARSVLFIEQEGSRVLEKMQGVSADQINSLDMINTLVDFLRSYPFALRVSQLMSLKDDPRFPTAPTAEDAAGMLVEHVEASYRAKTRLIDVATNFRDPTLATDVANAYADEYIRYVFEQRTEANKAATTFLMEEAGRLRSKMRVSEEAMQSFRERERAASLETMQESSQARLSEISAEITGLEGRLFQLDDDLAQANAHPEDVETLLRLSSVAAQPKVASLSAAIADQERGFALLQQRYRAKHPAYIATLTQLQSLRGDREKVLRDVVDLLGSERQRLQAQLAELTKAREAQEARLLTVTGKYIEYNDLKRNLETDRALYDSILNRMKEVDVTKGLTDSPVRIHERAVGAADVTTSPIKILAAGLFLGLALGLAIPLGLHFLDHSIKTVEQAEKISGLPVLAAVPKKAKASDNTLDSVTDRQGMVAEAFRSLRTSIAMVSAAGERRTFLFTSALPSEGKTFCSSNFAVTLAQQGFKTLLIDADLRKPMVSQVFFAGHRKPGLSEVLAALSTLSEAAIATDIENLDILTAGGRSPNPSELLALGQLPALIASALERYDRVVIDSAPVLAVSDSLLVAPHVDATCLVIRSFSTPRKTLTRALKALAEIQCQPVGTVFNFMPTGTGSDYYYSGRYYGSYQSKGVYGAS